MQNQLLAQYINTAHAANIRGEYAIAAKWCKQALQLAPDFPEALYNLGIALAGMGKRTKAIDIFDKLRVSTLKSADAQNIIGLQFIELGANLKAEQCLSHAILLAPDYAFPYSNMGKLRGNQNRYEDAESFLKKAIGLQPELAILHANLGANFNSQKKYVSAEETCRQAIALDSKLPDAWFHLGSALLERKHFEEAEAAMRKVIELDARLPKAWNNLGSALHSQMRYQEAEDIFRKAIFLDEKFSKAWNNLGSALQAQTRYQEAEAAFRKAISLDKDFLRAWNNLGITLKGIKNYAEAAECFGMSLKLNPDTEFMFGELLSCRMSICDWKLLANELPRLMQKIDHGCKVTSPFTVLGLTTDLAVQRKAAELWANDINAEQQTLGLIKKYIGHSKIRIGYYSSDFHIHPVTHLLAELFEKHSRDRFEFVGFSFGPDKNDEMRKRVSAAFDRFIDVRDLSGKAIAQLSRELEIDIAVDLNGYTVNCRTEIFSNRAAPVQVSYLGYPGTQGVNYIDYMIADKTVIPVENQLHYTEKIAYLPNSFFVYDSTRKIVDRIFTREDLGLPKIGFIYCCFNNSYKVTPEIFQGWMRILKQVENSILWLFNDNPASAENLRKAAKLHGIDPGRLYFTKHVTMDEHFARHYVADLFLDTLPYNAHTTACDALWTGLPVLTCVGESFASRVAASLLKAIDLPELITSSQDEYEKLAVELGRNPQKFSEIKQKLERNRLTSPLFNTAVYTKNIETAFIQMYERYQNDLPPEHIYLKE